MDEPRQIPWGRPEPPSDEELDRAIREEGLTPHWWSNGPGDVYSLHDHPYHKVLYCAADSITFIVEPEGKRFDLRPGDRLELPAGTAHRAVVGPAGVRCVEGWRYRSGASG